MIPVISIAMISTNPIGKPISGSCAKITGISIEPVALIMRVAIIERIETSVTPTAM